MNEKFSATKALQLGIALNLKCFGNEFVKFENVVLSKLL